MRTADCLKQLAEHRTDEIVLSAMTSATIWPDLSDHPRDLIYVPSTMGGASALAMGLAIAKPGIRVITLNGDGCQLMSLGSMVTIGEQAPENYALVVFDNGIYAVTGGQSLPGAGQVDFAGIAQAANWRAVHVIASLDEWTAVIPAILTEPGPVFIHAKVTPEPTSIGPHPVPIPERLETLRKALK
ncbi:MAG TPA: thiamine pyrophosphate-dependent enzyme [Armatimonadota bacterium]|nr:thiamine pyrophosphate-dependent enzyme [Armatimonadota bacterium]